MKRLWICFVLVMFVSFLILGWIGTRIYQEAPPIAARVVTTDGTVVIDEGEIAAGQNVWQTMGGMEVGSIWGHGSYVAPDWTADWLHREAIFILDRWANADFGSDYEQLDEEQQGQLSGRLSKLMRTNTYDLATQTITIDPIRADAFQSNLVHYSDVFTNGAKPALAPESICVFVARVGTLSLRTVFLLSVSGLLSSQSIPNSRSVSTRTVMKRASM